MLGEDEGSGHGAACGVRCGSEMGRAGLGAATRVPARHDAGTDRQTDTRRGGRSARNHSAVTLPSNGRIPLRVPSDPHEVLIYGGSPGREPSRTPRRLPRSSPAAPRKGSRGCPVPTPSVAAGMGRGTGTRVPLGCSAPPALVLSPPHCWGNSSPETCTHSPVAGPGRNPPVCLSPCAGGSPGGD